VKFPPGILLYFHLRLWPQGHDYSECDRDKSTDKSRFTLTRQLKNAGLRLHVLCSDTSLSMLLKSGWFWYIEWHFTWPGLMVTSPG